MLAILDCRKDIEAPLGLKTDTKISLKNSQKSKNDVLANLNQWAGSHKIVVFIFKCVQELTEIKHVK